jgi:hypothetical protein
MKDTLIPKICCFVKRTAVDAGAKADTLATKSAKRIDFIMVPSARPGQAVLYACFPVQDRELAGSTSHSIFLLPGIYRIILSVLAVLILDNFEDG